MSRQQAITPDHLFDRPWRPGRRFAPQSGRFRRWVMIGLLMLLCLIIGGYAYLTDANRVRVLAEQYLSSLVGGPVKVGGATLSVFEGLRLDDVRVYVDDQVNAPDSLVFSAQTFILKYDPRMMLAGRIEATQIVAQKPQVHLAENRDVGEWNYERLVRRRRHAPAGRPGVPGKPRVLPELLLRNARVTISEIRGGHEVARGLMAVDGRLAGTVDPDRYAFQLQSRGVSEGIGPYASGSVSLSTGNVVARLMNFEFDRDVRSMLPVEPREWWQRHELAGMVSMPEISFTPGKSSKGEQFKLVTVLNGVTLSVSPDEWMGRAEVTRLDSMRKTSEMMGGLYAFAGSSRRPSDNTPTIAEAPHSPGDRLAQLLRPGKITLKNVAGTFVFTTAGIEVKDVSGFIESNGLKINGHIDGYRPDATMALQIASFDTENLTIPASPRYVNSLPREVRDLYEQFKPEGECRIAIRVERPEVGAKPEVGGTVQILDGRFVFNRFAYPLRNVTGRIEFGRGTGGNQMLSLNVRGNGIATGPNRDTVLEIKTFGDGIAPIGTNYCGVNVRISGKNIASEDALRDAFAPEVRQALANFDAHKTGKYPQFQGDFVTEVVRPVGVNRRWTFDTDIILNNASGALVAFPYPLHDLSGTLKIRSGYAELTGMHMSHGTGADAASVNVDGRVAWTSPDGPLGPQPAYRARDAQLSPRADGPVKTALDVKVRNLPIDNELLAAIPAERRPWIKRLGASGKLDVDGKIFPSEANDGGAGGKVEWVVGGKTQDSAPAPIASAQDVNPAAVASAGPPLAYDLKLNVHDGTLRPFAGKFEATGVSAAMRLTSDQLTIEKVSARRGEGEVSTHGKIDWPRGTARVLLDGSATALPLDDALFELLPDAGKRAWEATNPVGTLDAEVHYDSAALEAERATSLAAQDKPANADAQGYRVVLKPRKLAITLKAVPYRLDGLTGVVTVAGNRVTVDDVTGRHADGKVSVTGTGVLGATTVWDMRIGGSDLAVNDELRKALPTTLAGLAESIKLKGKVGFDLTRFVYRSTEPTTPAVANAEAKVEDAALAAPIAPEPEIDVAGALNLDGASLDVGVPLTDVIGAVKIDAAVRNGHLDTLRGNLDFASMKMAGRAAKNFRADLFKPAGRGELSFAKMRGEVAGGAMSGRMTLVYPENEGTSRYALELVVRDADVRALAWETDEKMNGQLTASLSLEGSWGDAAQRRGRGDVMVSGKELKRIPLVLGLLQVTNLALPISSPFNEATAVYNLDGSRVIFEQIKLTASNMLMEGNGSLDFNTKKVDLTFTTDNPNGLLNLPFIKELWRGARNEMFTIHVQGTIQQPEVSAQSMGTFWTTVDEVFNGGETRERERGNATTPPKKRRQ